MAHRRDAIAGYGTTGALLRSINWAKTSLGPMSRWSSCAVAAAEMILASGFPLSAALGPDPTNALFLYNDAFIPFLGHKHPRAMARRMRDVWPEVWDFFEWALRQVWHAGQPVTGTNLLFCVERGDVPEELYASISFSPIWSDSGSVCGALICAIETTVSVIGERRERALRVIAHSLSEARTEEELHRGVSAVLPPAVKDIPFALLYVVGEGGHHASLRAMTGLAEGAQAIPREVDLRADADTSWALGRAVRERELRLVAPGDLQLSPAAALAGMPRAAAVVPVMRSPHEAPAAVLVVGLNPLQAFDHAYAAFLRRVAKEIGSALAGVRSLEDARRRAEALAELDRARTRFLANITHEFRTLVTLLIGPVEDLLDEGDQLLPAQRTQLQCVRRSAYRVLRYVTGLLDFARVDTGRAAVSFEPTDLACLTREIARAFEPAMTRAGLAFRIDCPPASNAVMIARDMWEQIVVNLLSNALKFTLSGEVALGLRITAVSSQLTVRDTGTGIAAEALPHLFERFYRVPQASARSHEGVGIGLALVKELVELHAGSIRVESTPGEGTTFTVEIPCGAVEPSARVREAPSPEAVAQSVAPFVEDALGWLEEGEAGDAEPPRAEDARDGAPSARVLVAEDSAEMRAYLIRLLRPAYEVEAALSGEGALAAARARPPDIVLSDVMMAQMDGLALVRALRADPATREIPIILISASGGEGATIDALGAGADDYLVKPFSARELRARVRTHLELSRARREGVESRIKDVFLGLASHELRTPLTCFKLNVQLCHRALVEAGSPLARRIEGLNRSIDRMTRFVNDMLNVSAVSSGTFAIRTARCDLASICRAAAAEQGQVIRREIALDLPDAPVSVIADEDRLNQVVSNLLSNAIKYSPEGRPVGLSLHAVEQEAIVRVRDAGPGIPAEALPHLFDRFYRVQSIDVQSGSYVGLGLGLFLAKAIVDKHNGRIWVETAVGEGSTFAFAIPLSA